MRKHLQSKQQMGVKGVPGFPDYASKMVRFPDYELYLVSGLPDLEWYPEPESA